MVAGVGYAWQHSHAFYLGPASELVMFEAYPGVVGGCALYHMYTTSYWMLVHKGACDLVEWVHTIKAVIFAV